MVFMIPRRSFLRGSAAASITTPFLLQMGRSAAATSSDTKALFVYVPDGVIPDLWHPMTNRAPFVLPDMTSPLQSIENDILFLRGLDMYAGGATHEGGSAKLLTGVGDKSLDVFLGEQVGGATPHRSVQLGVASTFQNGSNSISYVGAGQPIQPNDNPLDSYNSLFGQLMGQGPVAQAPDTTAMSLIDASFEEVKALQATLGRTERQKLEVHLDALREVEQRLSGTLTGSCNQVAWDSRGFVVNETDYYPLTYHKEEYFELIGQMQMDLIVLALGCGMTRVATLMWSHAVSPTHILATGGTSGHHDSSHYGDPAGQLATQFIGYKQWFMRQFVYLIERMRATPDVDGSLLDNSVVLLCTEINDGNLHDHTDMPFLLAGRAAGQISPGRALDFRGSNGGENETHTKLLVSIAQMLGAEIDAFGFTGKGTGPLAGLRE